MAPVGIATSEPPVHKRPLNKEALKEGALDLALNAVSILKEAVEDFKNSDRFFKYKAGVIGAWFFLSVVSLGASCPGATGPHNDIEARLVVAGDATRPVYMVKNDGKTMWKQARIVVNRQYSLTQNQVAPNSNVMVEIRLLVDDRQKPAPSDLTVNRIEIITEDDSATLFKDGRIAE